MKLLSTLFIKSGVNTGFYNENAASCHETTIFAIYLPEKSEHF